MTYTLSFTRLDTAACTVNTGTGRIANIKLSSGRSENIEKSE